MWGRPSQPEWRQNKQNRHLVGRQNSSWDVQIIVMGVCGKVERILWRRNVMRPSQARGKRGWFPDPRRNSSEGVNRVFFMLMGCHGIAQAFGVHAYNCCSLRVGWRERSLPLSWSCSLLRRRQDCPAMPVFLRTCKWRRNVSQRRQSQKWQTGIWGMQHWSPRGELSGI